MTNVEQIGWYILPVKWEGVLIHNGTVPIYWKIHLPCGLRDVSADGIWGKELKSGVVQEE